MKYNYAVSGSSELDVFVRESFTKKHVQKQIEDASLKKHFLTVRKAIFNPTYCFKNTWCPGI